jgi:hypothetical protein
MVQFLNTTAAYSEIENIVNRAEKKVVLISPFIRMPRLLLQRLSHAGENRGIKIVVICRKKELQPDEYSALSKIPHLEIIDLPNLHAKCFFNEKSMVITSLNLYESSPASHREMGVLITQDKEPAAFTDAVSEADFLLQTAYKGEADKMIARLQARQKSGADVSFFDIDAGLKRAFPTFAKVLSRSHSALDRRN